jgi:hypothetical protein
MKVDNIPAPPNRQAARGLSNIQPLATQFRHADVIAEAGHLEVGYVAPGVRQGRVLQFGVENLEKSG